jgi:hypothetical protein
MLDHAWVQENLDTYLAGELTRAERDRVERHADQCDSCGHALAEARQIEQMMSSVFADARHDPNLEERLVESLHAMPVRSAHRPMFWRIAVSAAAVLVVGLIGAAVQGLSGDDLFGVAEVKKDKESVQPGVDFVGGSSSVWDKELNKQYGTIHHGRNFNKEGFGDVEKYKDKLEQLKKFDSDPAALEIEREYKERTQGLEDDVKGPLVTLDRDKKDVAPGNPPGPVPAGKRLEGRDKEKEYGYDAPGRQPMPLKDVFKFRVDLDKGQAKAEEYYKVAEDVEKALKELKINTEKTKKDPPPSEGLPTIEVPPPLVTALKPTRDDALKSKLFATGPPMPTPSITPGYFNQPVAPVPPGTSPPPVVLTPPGGQPKPGDGGEKPGQGKGEPGSSKGDQKDNGQGKEGDQDKKPSENKPGGDKPGKETPKVEEPPAKVAPKLPIEANRKIIRTGEIDFEVTSFDKAVDDITVLIAGEKNKDGKFIRDPIPGAFVGTVNSDKLANGKMRGSIVVRMPPQFLDDFVRDLRRKLSEQGELKNQRIISLDVTKQYTDIESRLRAARAIEERLIQIIKTGKGEIKDLVAAEKELGVWRTKIEEMEGEIRYYSNQVALSTLTITLYEKEILAPTAIVITEHVRMRLEVDDVAKAHKAVMDAIEDAKINGRITKSELKQHVAGQLQSIIHAEIPPSKKIAFTVILQGLGITSVHDETQGQHSEGGSGKGSKIQRREDDVRFEIALYNTANVKPRLTADLKIATDDVPSAYDKLIKTINDPKVKGQIRDAKLDEKNKLNITGFIDFNVPGGAKDEIDKLIKSFGPELERFTVRAQVSELSTDRKFGYTILLRDFAAIPPQKAIMDIISTADVSDSYAKLQAAILEAKGQIADANLNELNKLDVVAKLDFTVPSDKKGVIDELLLKIGASMARTNVTAPVTQLSTNRKFGYVLTLRDLNTIQSNKSSDLKVSVVDVPAAYTKLTKAIDNAKGYVASTMLNDQDPQKQSALIVFSVPIAQKANMDSFLTDLGDVLKRLNAQAVANQLASDKKYTYTVALLDVNTVPATKASRWTAAVNDVPANYAKLTKAIADAKGHIADSTLNEQDKLNINAQILFSVPIAEKANMDRLLAELGDVLSRSNVPAPPNHLTSDKKFGYVVDLRDLITIEPSQRSKLSVAGANVPANYAKLLKEIADKKGLVGAAQLNEKDKLNISAQVTFIIPSDQKAYFEELLGKMGTTLSRDNMQASDKTQSTSRKFGYEVDLRDFANIPARETFTWHVTMSDVPATYDELKKAVTRARGWVSAARLDQDKKAEFNFDVPAAERGAIDQILTKAGALTSRTSSEVAVNTLATDQKVGYQVVLSSVASSKPREIVTLSFDIDDVDAKSSQITQILTSNKGLLIDSGIERKENGQTTAILVFDVPYSAQKTLIQQIGKPTTQKTTVNEKADKAPINEASTARLVITLNSAGSIISPESGVGAYVRKSLYLSFNILAIIGMSIIVGLSAIVPLVLLVWIGFKVYALMSSGESRSMAPTLATAAGPQPAADEDKPAEPSSGEPTAKP